MANRQKNRPKKVLATTKPSKPSAKVTQHNTIIEACYSMTLNEKRLLLLGISKVDPTVFPKANEPFTFSITAKEWASHHPQESPYKTLKRAAKQLRGRFVRLRPRPGIEEEINWVDYSRYIDREGRVELQFTRSMQVRLAGMLDQFTSVDLLSVNKLNSMYSVRMYELLSQFRSSGYRIMNLDDFRRLMDCVDNYPVLADLKRRVLLPAINEINLKTDLEVTATNVKSGRVVTGLEFKFKIKAQGDLFR